MEITSKKWNLDCFLPKHISIDIEGVKDDYAFRAEFNQSLPDDDKIAIAILIANAPDTLKALQGLLSAIKGGDKTAGFTMDDAIADAELAIANALDLQV